MPPVDSAIVRFKGAVSRIRNAKRRDVALFAASFILFFVLSSVAQVAFSPGTESNFDSSSIDNRETVSST